MSLRSVILALALGMGGCTRTVAVMQPRAALPADMTSCPDLPDLQHARTDADVANGIADLSNTARACRAHLDATRAVLNSGH